MKISLLVAENSDCLRSELIDDQPTSAIADMIGRVIAFNNFTLRLAPRTRPSSFAELIAAASRARRGTVDRADSLEDFVMNTDMVACCGFSTGMTEAIQLVRRSYLLREEFKTSPGPQKLIGIQEFFDQAEGFPENLVHHMGDFLLILSYTSFGLHLQRFSQKNEIRSIAIG